MRTPPLRSWKGRLLRDIWYWKKCPKDCENEFDFFEVEALRSEYECALVHLPFCSNDAVDNEGFSQLGYSLPKLGEMAVKTIEDEFSDVREMYLICHDWGAMIGYEMMALRPKMFKKCIAVDVGPMTSTSGNNYKSHINLCFLLTDIIVKCWKYSFSIYLFKIKVYRLEVSR